MSFVHPMKLKSLAFCCFTLAASWCLPSLAADVLVEGHQVSVADADVASDSLAWRRVKIQGAEWNGCLETAATVGEKLYLIAYILDVVECERSQRRAECSFLFAWSPGPNLPIDHGSGLAVNLRNKQSDIPVGRLRPARSATTAAT